MIIPHKNAENELRNLSYIIALGISVVLILVAHFRNGKAMKKLSPDEKISLIDGFLKMRKYSSLSFVCILAVYNLLINFSTIDNELIHILVFCSFTAFVLIRFVCMHIKLKFLKLPIEYIKSNMVTQTIQLIGLGVLFTASLLTILT